MEGLALGILLVLGESEGEILGKDDGIMDSEGSNDPGSTVGCLLGFTLGTSEGVSDGLLDGRAEGNGDGAGDGGLVGASDGASVASTPFGQCAISRKMKKQITVDFIVVVVDTVDLFSGL